MLSGFRANLSGDILAQRFRGIGQGRVVKDLLKLFLGVPP
jgi:hypothetical protein